MGPIKHGSVHMKENIFSNNKPKKYLYKIGKKYFYPKDYYKKYYTPVKSGPYFSSGKPKKMYIKNGKYIHITKPLKLSDFFGPPPPPVFLSSPKPRLLLPAPVREGQRGPIPYGYYYRHAEKVKQKMRDKRLAFNKALPPLNLICKYCTKPFVLPGMNENKHKQHVVMYCSSVCALRSKKLKKLWIPKWLYNYYIDKKLFRFIMGFKQSKHSIFSSKRRALFGLKNLNFYNFFILWHPNSFLRKKYKWIDKLVNNHQTKKRLKWKNKYQKTDEFRLQIRNWQKKQPKDSNFKIANALRASIVGALKRQGVRKHRRTEELLGTNKVTARKHIESLFKPGMTWKNHGQWHIDHKIPCASFDLKCPVQQLACCYYKNLQPLWAVDNMKKGAKLEHNASRPR